MEDKTNYFLFLRFNKRLLNFNNQIMTKKEIIERLKAGNKNFSNDKLSHENIDHHARKELVKGQDPFAIVLCCSDSRVIPELIFDTGLGEIYVVRVAGNIANTSSIGSMEYPVAHLNIKVIIVLGHQSCGAVTVALKGGDYGDNINYLLAHILPAIEASPNDASVDEVARRNAKMAVEEIKKHSEIISNAVQAGDLQIIPAYYNLDSGRVDFL